MGFFIAAKLQNQANGSFRRDINVLRAVAVMAVVFYHFAVPGFSGGFVGVDVFFVISGYLMTSIIMKGLEGDKFSILDFYFSRIRRILPALILLCATVLIIGWYLLAPDDYVVAAKHAQDALLFKSNNTFRKEAGYFDALSHDKWLLHTWSLSIEWQFYIMLPLLVSAAWRIFRNRISVLILLVGISIFSYIFCGIKTNEDSAKAFYMIKYRSWEMTIGGMIVFFPPVVEAYKKYLNAVLLIGYILIVGSVVFINKEYFWPGFFAAVPVIGSAMVIYSARNDFFLNRILPVNWIGTGSYSIYLWHWPVVVLLAYFQKSDFWQWIGAGIFSSLVLGWISYKFIEEKTRYGFGINKYISSALIVFFGVIVFCLAYLIVEKDGVVSRVDSRVVQISNEQRNTEKKYRNCVYGSDKELGPISCILGGNSLGAIVIGDSHASALASAVLAAMPGNDAGIYVWSRAACPFVRGVHARIRKDCDAYAPWVFDRLKNESKNIPVILIARSSLYVFGENEGVVGNKIGKPPIFFEEQLDSPTPEFLKEFKERSIDSICELASDRKVYLLRPIPEMKLSIPQVMARYKMMGINKRVSISMDEYLARHQFVFELQDEAKLRCGVDILDPVPYLCDKDQCYGDLNGRPLYADDDHLSESGNKVLVPMFSKIFNGLNADYRGKDR